MPSIPYMSPAAIGDMTVSPEGDPVARNRSPMADRVASGHPSPEDELIDTVASLGTTAAAASIVTIFDPITAGQLRIGSLDNLHRASCRRGFLDGESDRQ